MNNLQKIIEYAKDPSCIACISPMFGGAWHSIIRTGEGPQPSTVMRNFATEPENWYNFHAWWAKQNPADDFEFDGQFQNTIFDAFRHMFYGVLGSDPFSIWVQTVGNQMFFATALAKVVGSGSNFVNQSIGTSTGDITTCKMRLIGNNLQIIADGVTLFSAAVERVVPPVTATIKSNAGYAKFSCRNLTTGSHWGYPSIAEKVRLLTKYNCDTSQGDFRLVNISQNNWYVKTGLNFAGWSRPLTIIGRMHVAPDSGGANVLDYDTGTIHPLLAQGWPVSTDYTQLVLTIGYNNTSNSNQYFCKFSAGSNVQLSFALDHDPRGTIVTIALTVDPATGEYKFYENGVLLFNGINSALIGFVLRTDTSHVNNDANAYLHQRIDSYQNRNDRVFWCMVFDRVLNDAEIKFLST